MFPFKKVRIVNLATPRSQSYKCSEGINHGPNYSPESKMDHYTGESKLYEVDVSVLQSLNFDPCSFSQFFYEIISERSMRLHILRISKTTRISKNIVSCFCHWQDGKVPSPSGSALLFTSVTTKWRCLFPLCFQRWAARRPEWPWPPRRFLLTRYNQLSDTLPSSSLVTKLW